MSKKITFSESNCLSCQYYQTVGTVGTRYCNGFKRKKPKRFKNSDPHFKAPRWCPKRISPPLCRIYELSDDSARFMDLYFTRARLLKNKATRAYPMPQHYRFRCEIQLGMTAKQFYHALQENHLENIISDSIWESGEVIEIDDGLQPYYFYHAGYGNAVPAGLFDPQKCKRNSNT